MSCAERDDDEPCCTHEIQEGVQHYPGEVCCWCGDIYISENDGPHGEYRPKFQLTPEGR